MFIEVNPKATAGDKYTRTVKSTTIVKLAEIGCDILKLVVSQELRIPRKLYIQLLSKIQLLSNILQQLRCSHYGSSK